MTTQQILLKYWGHSNFRPLQEEIINSVLEGKDTLTLLPTGGGKSICFQIPAMVKDGICIVVSPLIALMKDQVENLQKKGIKAMAITSTMHKREMDIAFDNCIYGNVKFLYLSPERLNTELAKVRISKMNINLIAVDEAHCISQWGYDFRPSYLNIIKIRDIKPQVPIIALTATATPKVAKDIQQKLGFKKENILQKSFERKNLSYSVLEEENIPQRLIKIINKIKGSGIIYLRNRKKTKEIADLLMQNKISAEYYHAGLTPPTREKVQNNWINNKTKVIVCTNAFGMGIDKPDVRFVIHLGLPECIEEYFQESGRAGRDEKKSYAILFYNETTRIELESNINKRFPSIDEIKKTYKALGNYYNLAIGSGEAMSFSFDIADFCNTYQLSALTVFNSIKFLEKEGYISTTEAINQSSKIHLIINKGDLYKFQVENKKYDDFIKLILRSYTGAFEDYISIRENDLAKRNNITKDEAIKTLEYLDKMQILSYIKQTNVPQIIFTLSRADSNNINISKGNYENYKQQVIERMEWMIHYASSKHKCRSQLLLSYFGEKETFRCGICDVCLERNKLDLNDIEFKNVSDQIKIRLKQNNLTLTELVNSITNSREDKVLKVVQWLIDNDKLMYDENNKLKWKK